MNKHDDNGSSRVRSGTGRKSGRAAFDIDGRSVWEWQTATGVFSRNVTDDQLASLSAVELKIEESPRQDTNALVLTGARRQTPAAIKSSRRAEGAKRSLGGVTGWLRRGWLG